MRLSLGLEQKLVQKQVLAPRMIQSMEILQLPLLALEERIEQELNDNPILEMRESDPDMPEEPTDRDDPDGFGIVNLTVIAKDFIKGFEGLELRGSVYNLFDEDYAFPTSQNTLPDDLPMPGINYYAEVRYSF